MNWNPPKMTAPRAGSEQPPQRERRVSLARPDETFAPAHESAPQPERAARLELEALVFLGDGRCMPVMLQLREDGNIGMSDERAAALRGLLEPA